MLYNYEAANTEGAIETGEFEATSKAAVVEYLKKRDLIPISINEKGDFSKGILKLSFGDLGGITAMDRIIFVRNLAATIKSGLNIIESLDILIADASKRTMKKVLTTAKTNLQNGKPLSETFASFKKFFPVIFVGMMKAGEAAGNLDKTLDELAHHMTREYNLSKKVKSALAYPVLLLIASIGVITLLLIFIIPQLTKAFKQSGADLPGITKFIISLSNIFTASLTADVIIFGIIIWFFISFRKTSLGQKIFLWIIFKIPVARELVKKVALVRLTRTLGSLIKSGTSIIEALSLASEAVGNLHYRNALRGAAEQMKSGVPLSKAMDSFPELFPKFLTSLVAVGERTGTLEGILKNFSDFYDEEIDNSLKDLTTFLEPVLLLFMGLIIGAISLSILMPIYKLVGNFR